MNNQVLSKSLYVEGLRKIKVPSIIFAAIIFITQFIVPLLTSAEYVGSLEHEVVGPAEILSSMMIIPCVMAPILTLTAFFAFNKRSSSDFYHSLPYTRTCLYFSWALAVLTVTAALVVGGGILGYVVKLIFHNYFIITFSGLADMMLSFLSASVFAIACVSIAMSLTGTFITNAACSLLLLFLPRLIMYLARLLVISQCTVLTYEHFLNWADITYNTYVSGIGYGLLSIYNGSSSGWIGNIGADIFTLVVGIVYTVCAVLLFKHRKSETAGQGSVNRLVQHIIRIAMTLALALLGTYLLIEMDESVLGIVVYCIAVVVFFAYEIIVTKKWLNLVKVLPSLAIVAGLTAAVWIGANAACQAIYSQHLDASSITSIRLPEFLSSSQSYFREKCEDTDIVDEKVIQYVVDAYNEELDNINAGLGFAYMNTGTSWTQETVAFNTALGTKYRYIAINDTMIKELAAMISTNREYMKVFTDIPEPIYASFAVKFAASYNTYTKSYGYSENTEECKELYETLCNELKTVDAASWAEYIMKSAAGSEMCDLCITYNADNSSHNTVTLNISYDITPETYEKALQFIAEHQDTSEFTAFFDNGYEEAEDSYMYLNTWIYYTDENGNIQELSSDSSLYSAGYDELKELILAGLYSDGLVTAGNWIRVEYDMGYQDSASDFTGYNEAYGSLALPLVSDWQDILAD